MDTNDEQKALIDQLPVKIWLHIFQFLNEREMQKLVFAYP